jgi:hypothetical protein
MTRIVTVICTDLPHIKTKSLQGELARVHPYRINEMILCRLRACAAKSRDWLHQDVTQVESSEHHVRRPTRTTTTPPPPLPLQSATVVSSKSAPLRKNLGTNDTKAPKQ